MIKDVILSSQTINKENKVKKELVNVFPVCACVCIHVYVFVLCFQYIRILCTEIKMDFWAPLDLVPTLIDLGW